jgi:hypothetical protein
MLPIRSRGQGPVRLGGASTALAWSALSRALLVVAVLVVARLSHVGGDRAPFAGRVWWLDRFDFWDSYHLVRIAEQGYFAPGRSCCDQAWFPGFPLLVRGVSGLTDGGVVASGIAISWLGAVLSGVLLWGLVRDQSGRSATARRALWLLLAAPFGVFFVALYSESVWMVFALLAWWAALRGWWWAAGIAAGAAAAVRVNGLFLVAALAVMYLVRLRSSGRWARPRLDALALAFPVLPVIAYAAWLHGRTGSWTAWHDAELRGWGRATTWPWEAFVHQLQAISAGSDLLRLTRSVDLVMVLGGVALVVLAAWMRRWPEAVFLAMSVGVVATSWDYDSAGRYALSWFPAYWLLAELGEGHRRLWRLRWLLVIGWLGLGLTVTTLFAQRHWVA